MDQATATAQAEALVRAYCGWHVAPVHEDEVLVLDGPGTGTLLLPSLHVTAIASITEDATELDPTSYQWSAAGLVRRRVGTGDDRWFWVVSNQTRWTNNLRGIEVKLTHGYDTMPAEVQGVIDRLVTRSMEGASVLAAVGAVQYATGEDGLPASGTLTSSDKAVLAPYRLPPRP